MSLTPEMKEYVHKYHEGVPIYEMARRLTEEFEREVKRTEVAGYYKNNKIRCGVCTRFQKGMESHNKGKKMPENIKEKCLKTAFKKGNKPHNTTPVGTIRLRPQQGYMWIKVSEPNKWKLLHRYNWEQKNGKLKNGEILEFLDGDKTNCAVENLRVIGRAGHLELSRRGWRTNSKEINEVAINTVRLIEKIGEKE